jgi:ABC-type sugar transport system substrate-binding protein
VNKNNRRAAALPARGRSRNNVKSRCLGIPACALIVLCASFSDGNLAFGQNEKIGMLPKFTSDPYFVAVNQGAQEAAKELQVSVEFNGPVDANVAAQANIIDQWIRAGMNAITVSANDANALAPALERAAHRGIKVSTFDADVKPEARQVFLNQCTFDSMGKAMVEMMAKEGGSEGDFLVVTAVLTAPNQNRWIEEVKKYAAGKYPNMHFAAVLPGDEDLEKSKNVALNYLRANPSTKGVLCVTGIATPGVAEAVKQLGLQGKVAVTGLGVPSLVRPYIKDGTIKEVALWNPVDIGYGAIYIAKAQLDGTLKPESGFVEAGRLGKLKFIQKDVALLGDPLIITASNVDDFKF